MNAGAKLVRQVSFIASRQRLAFLCVLPLVLSTSAFAQNANDFMRTFGGIVQQAMVQAAQAEWRRLPPNELSCVDQGLRQQGASVDALANRGVLPSDPRLRQLRANCRGPIVPTAQPLNQSSPYVVDGLALGGQVVFESQTYRQYHCTPSEKFPGFTWCHKEETKKERQNEILSSNSILHTPDGTAWYVNRYIEPAFFGPSDVQSEIDRLSAKFSERPREMRLPPRGGLSNAVIDVWGRIELEQIDATEVSTVAAGGAVKGLLVSYLGDLQRSAKAGVPVYRLAGGAGFLWAATFDRQGKGVLRFLTVDASKIANSAEASNKLTSEQPSTEPRPSRTTALPSEWITGIAELLARNKRYPTASLDRQEEGTVVVAFTVDRGGHVTESKITQSSGSASLDHEALELLARTQPLPPFPSSYDGHQISLSVPIRFSLSVTSPQIPEQQSQNAHRDKPDENSIRSTADASDKPNRDRLLEETIKKTQEIYNKYNRENGIEETLDAAAPAAKSVPSEPQTVKSEGQESSQTEVVHRLNIPEKRDSEDTTVARSNDQSASPPVETQRIAVPIVYEVIGGLIATLLLIWVVLALISKRTKRFTSELGTSRRVNKL
jgi:TonB family protein